MTLCWRGTSHRHFIRPSVSVRVSSSLQSITLRYCIKMAERRITRTMLHDRPKSIVFGCQRFWRNLHGSAPMGAPNASGVGKLEATQRWSAIYCEWPWTLTYQIFLLCISSQDQDLYSHQKLNMCIYWFSSESSYRCQRWRRQRRTPQYNH